MKYLTGFSSLASLHVFICPRLCVLFTDLVAQRGEKLELLIDKTESLVDSVSFKMQTLTCGCHIYTVYIFYFMNSIEL